jgi:hypothetical protein
MKVEISMALLRVIWDLDDDPDGNIQHVAEHGLTPEEVEQVLDQKLGSKPAKAEPADCPRSSGGPKQEGTLR